MDKKIVFDYSKLHGRIVEKFKTQKAFCDAAHMSQACLSHRLTGLAYFTLPEISRIAPILDIEGGEYSSYFFTQKV